MCRIVRQRPTRVRLRCVCEATESDVESLGQKQEHRARARASDGKRVHGSSLRMIACWMVAPCGDVVYDARRDFAPRPTRRQHKESDDDDCIRGRRRSVDGGNKSCEQSSVLTTASEGGSVWTHSQDGRTRPRIAGGLQRTFLDHIGVRKLKLECRTATGASYVVVFCSRHGWEARHVEAAVLDGWLAAVSRQQEWLNNKRGRRYYRSWAGRSSRGCSAKGLAVGHRG